MVKVSYSFLILWVVHGALGQDCRFPGESCSDSYNCCGGCCRNEICIDEYADCRLSDDVCLGDVSCPVGTFCKHYQPECKGCPAQKLCIPIPEPPLAVNRTAFEYARADCSSLKPFGFVILIFSLYNTIGGL